MTSLSKMPGMSAQPNWTTALAAHHFSLVQEFIRSNPQSQEAFQQAQLILPGGNTRSVLNATPFPLSIESAQDAFVTSVDGKRYLDFVSDFSAGLFGHSHPEISHAVETAVNYGFSLGAVTRKEAKLASTIQERFVSIEQIRFCNSGTEANIYAIATSMAFTKRSKILVFSHGYHGGVLSFGAGNQALNIPHDFAIGVFDNIEKTRSLISRDLAAILVEPMQSAGGMRVASREFLSFLRTAADETGAILIFDEVVTSRLHYNGLQGYHGIKPDMTTLGKYLGGGLPFGAFGGREDIMSQFNPTSSISSESKLLQHSGTFNNNVFTMSAALAASKIVTPEEIQRINNLGDRLRERGNQISHEAGFGSELMIIGFGSCVGLYFANDPDGILRDCFYFSLLRAGIMIGRRGFLMLNFAHTDVLIERTLVALQDCIGVIQGL
ncbi:uncharacterized protein N7496_007567 [Penicillium cataractarum]|uniref:Glutamate-1-semialdehyde 2,1-aminomutase n=1 Tax=Penicillium cataractarum TaxID=2100454 RepID=A0A9W9S502_9EURO|nr:uncharacterized protein N7496_007567 [Penicillium cataractarum]KAJ5371475.1 hypothetical protein N7496_007567 [Penicillium cataractarum]